jgi:hypothetical protein
MTLPNQELYRVIFLHSRDIPCREAFTLLQIYIFLYLFFRHLISNVSNILYSFHYIGEL